MHYKMPQIANIISNLKSTKSKFISLELCPNRNVDMEKLRWLSPPFCSVTWIDNNLLDIQNHPSVVLAEKLHENGNTVLLHLPGRILNKEKATDVLKLAQKMNVTNIFALQGENALVRNLDLVPNDFTYAIDLVSFVRSNFGNSFSICVTGYPDGHPKAKTEQADLQYLKEKVDAGANFIVTQSIFDTITFERFYNKSKELDIDIPILPGIYIINSYEALMNMAKYCKLNVPGDILKFVCENKDDENVIREYGICKATEIIQYLLGNQEMSAYIFLE